MTETEKAAELIRQIQNAEGCYLGGETLIRLRDAIKAAEAHGAAAERERIRANIEELHELALEGHMPFGDPYFEGAKDYCKMALQVIDAGEPTPETSPENPHEKGGPEQVGTQKGGGVTSPDVEAPDHAAPHCIVRKT